MTQVSTVKHIQSAKLGANRVASILNPCHASNRVTCGAILIRVLAIGMLIVAAGPSRAMDSQGAIAFAENRIGKPPAGFDLGDSGSGHPVKWTIVRDPTASQGFALEQT